MKLARLSLLPFPLPAQNPIPAFAGRTAPQGTIRLSGAPGKLNIRSGSGLLLRVLGS